MVRLNRLISYFRIVVIICLFKRLGIILGSKLAVDFMKYDFDESIRLLRFEIQVVFKGNQISKDEIVEVVHSPPVLETVEDQKKLETVEEVITNVEEDKPVIEQIEKPIAVQNLAIPKEEEKIIEEEKIDMRRIEVKSRKTDAINWSESQVYQWFVDKNIESSIMKPLWPCDGQMLYEFYLIKNETPDFFYKSLSNWIWGPTLRDITHFSIELKRLFST